MCEHKTTLETKFGTCWCCADGPEMEAIDAAASIDPDISASIEAEVSKVWGPGSDDE